MAIELFGFRLGKIEDEKKKKENTPSFTAPSNDDGAMTVAAGGQFGYGLDMDGASATEAQLITKYRSLALSPEGERAIDDIVNDSVIVEDHEPVVKVLLDKLDGQNDKIKKKITDEFEEVLRLLDFQNNSYDIFKRWYVDGRLYYHKMIDVTKPKEGLKELRYIDPRKIRKVRKPIETPGGQAPLAVINQQFDEFYLFNEKGIAKNTTEGIKVAKDSISYVHSGLINESNNMVLSHLHKALKIFNQMNYMEDALVIYRISRAPERRIFYIDVGNLPKMKAEQYLRDMMVKHKNKLVYDANTGQVKDDRKFQTMMEDFWLPRREGGKGTEISTLPGGQNLSDIEDVQYFKNKFYRALNVPETRLDNESGFNLGRASEITRDELKFSKFVNRLRLRFSLLFDDLLETQLILKGITDKKGWDEMKNEIFYDFKEDNFFTELKKHEITQERLNILDSMDGYVGRYYSLDFIKEEILHQDEEMRARMTKEMAADESDGEEEGEGDTNFGAFAGRPDVAVEPPLEELPPGEGAPPAEKPTPKPQNAKPKTAEPREKDPEAKKTTVN